MSSSLTRLYFSIHQNEKCIEMSSDLHFEHRLDNKNRSNIMSEKKEQQNKKRSNNQKDKFEHPKKDVLLELAKYKDLRVRVKFTNGRQVTGFLKGYDQLMNLVLDESVETLRSPNDDSILTDETRELGLVVVRGTLLLTIAPVDGSEEIENPFIQQEQEQI